MDNNSKLYGPLTTWERNGYDDSDFFASYWDDEKKAVVSFETGSTRYGGWPDGYVFPADHWHWAKPLNAEVVAAAVEWLVLRNFDTFKQHDAVQAETVQRGRQVEVVKGRKVKIGSVGLAIGDKHRASYSYNTETVTITVRLPDGTCPLVNIENLRVINPAQYLTPDAELMLQARATATRELNFSRQSGRFHAWDTTNNAAGFIVN